MNRLSMRIAAVSSMVVLMVIAGCASLPERIPELESAGASVQTLEREPNAQTLAATQLSNARSALARAETAKEEGGPMATIRHEASVAQLNAEIGLERIAEAEALERIEEAEVERTRVQLEARTAAAERAEIQAREMQLEAERSQQTAQAATAEAQRLQQELSDLQAKQTRRGLVLTLGDVLFETDEAELAPGAAMPIDRLADFMEDNPERRLRIEGHTDSRGSEEYNQDLSHRRAYAVTEALVQRGIESNRLRPVGLGESYPAASNDTEAGRQRNRRVEVVVSDEEGTFPEAADRIARRQ
jgi:outer membrane protein OmpA-like peptidoglycan-associated protein